MWAKYYLKYKQYLKYDKGPFYKTKTQPKCRGNLRAFIVFIFYCTLVKHIPLSIKPECLVPKGSWHQTLIDTLLYFHILYKKFIWKLCSATLFYAICLFWNFLFWTPPLLCQPFLQTYKHKSMALMTNDRGSAAELWWLAGAAISPLAFSVTSI